MPPLKVDFDIPEVSCSIDDIAPAATNVNYKTDYDESTRTFTLTMPTVTDFSQLVLDFDYQGDKLTADGREIESGVTPIDATNAVG